MAENIETKGDMISIWTWVGLLLGLYGLLITIMGVHYAISPETATATARYNPSLWWGLIMLAAAGIFLGAALWRRKKEA